MDVMFHIFDTLIHLARSDLLLNLIKIIESEVIQRRKMTQILQVRSLGIAKAWVHSFSFLHGILIWSSNNNNSTKYRNWESQEWEPAMIEWDA